MATILQNSKLIKGVVLGGLVGGAAYLIDSKTGNAVTKNSKKLAKKAMGTVIDQWNNFVPNSTNKNSEDQSDQDEKNSKHQDEENMKQKNEVDSKNEKNEKEE